MAQLWDPLWEYVLEDYDAEDRRKRENARQASQQRGKKVRPVPTRTSNNRTKKKNGKETNSTNMNYLNFFADDDNESDNDDGDDDDYDDDAGVESREWDRSWLDDGREEREGDTKNKPLKGILRRGQSKDSNTTSARTMWTPFADAGSKSSSKKDRNNPQELNVLSGVDVWEFFVGPSDTPSPKKANTKSILKKETSNVDKTRSNTQTTHDTIDVWEMLAGPTYVDPRNQQSQIRTRSTGKGKSLKGGESESTERRISFARGAADTSLNNSGVAQTTKQRTGEVHNDPYGEVWDVLTGTPPVNTKRPVERNPDRGTSSENKSRRFGVYTSQSESSSPGKKRSEVKNLTKGEKVKGIFKRRPESSQNVEDFSHRKQVDKTITKIDEPVERKSTEKRVQGESQQEESDEMSLSEFDPMLLLLDVAGRLDPWGNDSSFADTNSETWETETSSMMSETHSGGVEENPAPFDKMKSLLDQPLPDPNNVDLRYPYHPTRHTGHTTEIRLRVNPMGGTLSEEVYERARSLDYVSESDAYDRNSHGWEESASKASYTNASDSRESGREILKPRTCFGGYSNSRTADDADGATYDEELGSLRRDHAIKRCKFPSDEVRIPRDLHFETKSSIFDDEETLFDEFESRAVWKRIVCCSAKNLHRGDLVSRLKRADAAEVFPTTRMISNDTTHAITGQKADYVNGVMGVPSERFVESKGPQSLYAYDYESTEHMDVQYQEPNQNPRLSLSVRSLGPPPSIFGDEIVIQVEACTVSETDCIIRQGKWWGEGEIPFPNTPGVDVVGKVFHVKRTTESMYDLHPRQTVLSLVKFGGNSRYISLHPSQLVKVPDGLDPAVVACLPETYLSAFQVLHRGQAGSKRYRENSLKGKSVLIIGAMSNNMGKAIIELALAAQAANIYATAKKKHWKTLISYGIMPLSQDAMEWSKRLEGMIDLVLAPNGSRREDILPVHFRALIPKHGQLILCGRRVVGNDIPINDWKTDQGTLACGKNRALTKMLNKSYAYDVYEEWQNNLELCKRDLSHLLRLLEGQTIKPDVLDRLPLNKVAKAHELLETKGLPGFLVCEPWMQSKKRAVYL